nr:glycosyltransferase [uncultured Carboxylicivirga sp.]
MKEKASHKRRILISPLNWGLGHATRLLPIIDNLIKDGHQCYVAGEKPSINVIQQTFPNLTFIILEDFQIKLSGSNNQLFKLTWQLPGFLKSLNRDRKTVKELVKRFNIDFIISDNRYGFRHRKITSVIVTHQTNIRTGRLMCWSKPMVQLTLKYWINRFDSCWIPDINDTPSIAGQLANKALHCSSHRIGLTSRLKLAINPTEVPSYLKNPDILIILSGPEPQRSIFEKLIVRRYINSDLNVILLRGRPDTNIKPRKHGSVTFLEHCDINTYQYLLNKSKQIICRSGYSTLMDLFHVNRKAILIPTPGQYEQEYLAMHMKKHFHFTVVIQKKILTTSRLAFGINTYKATANSYANSFRLPPLNQY